MPTRPSIKVIGLTGGIGAGKSTVAGIFAELGCIVSDSDAHSRAVLAREEVRAELVRWWGPSVLDADGAVDRTRVASIVFSDPEARRRLEGLVHPLIAHAREADRTRAMAESAPALVIDAPLLLEAGLDRQCDAIVFVDAPEAARLARVRETRGWDAGELHRREAAQMPLAEKRRRSGFVLKNDGPRADVAHAARAILDAVLKDPGGPRPRA